MIDRWPDRARSQLLRVLLRQANGGKDIPRLGNAIGVLKASSILRSVLIKHSRLALTYFGSGKTLLQWRVQVSVMPRKPLVCLKGVSRPFRATACTNPQTSTRSATCSP
jgi:hypothetical protein